MGIKYTVYIVIFQVYHRVEPAFCIVTLSHMAFQHSFLSAPLLAFQNPGLHSCSIITSLFKVMLTGVDVDAIYERTTAVAAAAADVAYGARIIAAVKALATGLT